MTELCVQVHSLRVPDVEWLRVERSVNMHIYICHLVSIWMHINAWLVLEISHISSLEYKVVFYLSILQILRVNTCLHTCSYDGNGWSVELFSWGIWKPASGSYYASWSCISEDGYCGWVVWRMIIPGEVLSHYLLRKCLYSVPSRHLTWAKCVSWGLLSVIIYWGSVHTPYLQDIWLEQSKCVSWTILKLS